MLRVRLFCCPAPPAFPVGWAGCARRGAAAKICRSAAAWPKNGRFFMLRRLMPLLPKKISFL